MMKTNPWTLVKFVDDGTNPYLYPKAEPVPAAPTIITPTSSGFTGDYILMPRSNTYALGVEALRQACTQEKNQHQPKVVINGREFYRQNSFFENGLARIIDFNTLTHPDGTPRTMEERLRYFNTWLDSSCGVAYQAKTTKLKLSLVCLQLIGIDKDFAGAFLPVDYANFPGTELDSSSSNFVRDSWMTLLEGDNKVYQEYLAVLKAAKGTDVIPGFWKRQNTATDELRAVCVLNLGINADAYGNNDLNSGVRFLRRSP